MDEYTLELLLEEEREAARVDEDFKTDAEIVNETLRTCGHMTDFAFGLLMQKEDDYMRTWGRIYR